MADPVAVAVDGRANMLEQVASSLEQLTEKCVNSHSQLDQFETLVNSRLTSMKEHVSRLQIRPPIEKHS